MRDLPYTWDIGKSRHTHAGFAVFKIIGRMHKPMEMASGPFDSAERALDAADRLGEGYATYRVHKSKSGTEPFELIQRKDIPVTVNLNPKTRK